MVADVVVFVFGPPHSDHTPTSRSPSENAPRKVQSPNFGEKIFHSVGSNLVRTATGVVVGPEGPSKRKQNINQQNKMKTALILLVVVQLAANFQAVAVPAARPTIYNPANPLPIDILPLDKPTVEPTPLFNHLPKI